DFQQFTIAGQVFDDTNGNGRADPGEPGVAFVIVQLDVGADGTTDRTATTDASGAYRFSDLGPGVYRVRFAGLNGAVQTSTDPGDVLGQSGAARFGVDFGTFRLASIRGQTFEDSNGNNARAPGEPTLANWVVFLDTDGDGQRSPGEPTATA